MTFGIAPSTEKYSLHTHSTFTRHDKIRHTYTNIVFRIQFHYSTWTARTRVHYSYFVYLSSYGVTVPEVSNQVTKARTHKDVYRISVNHLALVKNVKLDNTISMLSVHRTVEVPGGTYTCVLVQIGNEGNICFCNVIRYFPSLV